MKGKQRADLALTLVEDEVDYLVDTAKLLYFPEPTNETKEEHADTN